MICKILNRNFFLEPDILKASTVLSFDRSPITCFNLVANMPSYPEFVPWMKSISLKSTSPTTKDCISTIGYPPFNQSYLSKVTLTFPTKIVSIANNTDVFEVLESIWEFQPHPSELKSSDPEILLTKCQSLYSVKFKFNSVIYQSFSSIALNLILTETSKAFVNRAKTLPNDKCLYNKQLKQYIEK